jgi:hypothetical protein
MNDAFQSYESVDAYGKHPHPNVPEPSTYGAIFFLLAFAIILYRRSKRDK